MRDMPVISAAVELVKGGGKNMHLSGTPIQVRCALPIDNYNNKITHKVSIEDILKRQVG
jgi:hypothetical protein